MRLFGRAPDRRAIQPNDDKGGPSSHGDPDAANPYPRTANLPTSRPLVVGKVANSHLSLIVNVGEEGTAVVDTEVEDAVLVGGFEGDAKNGGVCGLANGRKI